MATDPGIAIRSPIPASECGRAAELFWAAFENKLGRFLGPKDRALGFIRRVLDPTHGIAALDEAGKMVGLAGFKTPSGALVGGEWADLRATYGDLGAAWRVLPLMLFERNIELDQLLMDGIVVAPEARGKGIGTALLNAIKEHAAELGLTSVRLDVIDSNPRAHALYERQGFRATKTTGVWPFHRFFGFRTSSEMVFDRTNSITRPPETRSHNQNQQGEK